MGVFDHWPRSLESANSLRRAVRRRGRRRIAWTGPSGTGASRLGEKRQLLSDCSLVPAEAFIAVTCPTPNPITGKNKNSKLPEGLLVVTHANAISNELIALPGNSVSAIHLTIIISSFD